MATATISDRAVLERARAYERPYWYIIAFSVAGILAGGLLTARAVMREVKLAKLKAGFVSNVSHGLKTPLTSLKMFSEMLRSGQVKDEAERRECLDVIAQETERLGRLIQQVLDFGKLEARRQPFHWTTGPLEPVVRAEAERFRRATGLAGEAFVLRIAVNTPPVTHDPDAFADVVSNLLSNAYKYTRREDRRIELTLGPERGRVVLAVEDNGPGVPRRERRRIFEQFYRANDLLTREVEGTGLGLAIARHIVRAHGGRIFVVERQEGGSRFVVVLPSAAAPRAAAPATPAEA
jgi:signal transduction histidine kinase